MESPFPTKYPMPLIFWSLIIKMILTHRPAKILKVFKHVKVMLPVHLLNYYFIQFFKWYLIHTILRYCILERTFQVNIISQNVALKRKPTHYKHVTSSKKNLLPIRLFLSSSYSSDDTDWLWLFPLRFPDLEVLSERVKANFNTPCILKYFRVSESRKINHMCNNHTTGY